MRNIIKYVGIILVIAGILIVMKNLFAQDGGVSNTGKNKNKEIVYYSAKIKLLDKETDAYLNGATLILKKESGEVVERWTTEGGVHLVSKLKKGKYVVEQESSVDGYHLNEEGVSFEIKNKDKEVILYNTKMTEEEIEEARRQNTVSNEVGVDNTLSERSIWAIIGGIASIGIGVGLILVQRRSSSNDV